jgi:hypothetical protein
MYFACDLRITLAPRSPMTGILRAGFSLLRSRNPLPRHFKTKNNSYTKNDSYAAGAQPRRSV